MLTDLQIEKMAIPATRREIPDGKVGGLYLVVQPSGQKSWALRYRVAGAPKKFTIGSYPAVSLGAARRKAQKAMAEVVDGLDPSAQKKAAREAQKAANTTEDRVENVVESFIKRHLEAKAKPSWAKEGARLLRAEINPKFGKRRLGEISAKDVDKLLGEIAERAPITANRTLAVFRKLCNWAVSPKVGLIGASPCAGVEAPTVERSRERVLSDDEVKFAWGAFDVVGWPFGPLAKLLLLTGARRDEVASMEWREVDLAAKVWRIPSARTKNKRPHEIPLSDTVVAILKEFPKVETGREKSETPKPALVFTTTGKTSVSGFSRAKDAIDAVMLELLQKDAENRGRSPNAVTPPQRWVIHDLRRTVATNLQKLGIKLEVTEAVLNHVSGSRAGIVGVYQRHEYATEKRQALDAWAHRLEAIVSGDARSNVVELAEARA
jgi:integrase